MKCHRERRKNLSQFKLQRASFRAIFDALFWYSYLRETENLQNLQTTVSGGKGILRALPVAIHVESRIVVKRRLSFGDGRAAFADASLLVFLLFRFLFTLKFNAELILIRGKQIKN